MDFQKTHYPPPPPHLSDNIYIFVAKTLLQISSNSLVLRQNKQTKKQQQIFVCKYWVSKLNYKIEFFVPYKGHQNCLDKSLIWDVVLVWFLLIRTFEQWMDCFNINWSMHFRVRSQGFPQVLRTWGSVPPSPHWGMVGALQNLMGGGLESIHRGSMGYLKCCWKIPVKEFIC